MQNCNCKISNLIQQPIKSIFGTRAFKLHFKFDSAKTFKFEYFKANHVQ